MRGRLHAHRCAGLGVARVGLEFEVEGCVAVAGVVEGGRDEDEYEEVGWHGIEMLLGMEGLGGCFLLLLLFDSFVSVRL